MKKSLFILVGLSFLLFGCPHDAKLANGESTVQENQYSTISSLAYIGGSVVYNPSNPLSAQLHNSAKIAVHLGKVTPNTVQAETYKYTPQTPSTKWNEQSKQIASVKIDENSNIYGYLNIRYVSS